MRSRAGIARRGRVAVDPEGHHVDHRDIDLHPVGVGGANLVALLHAVKVAEDGVLVGHGLVEIDADVDLLTDDEVGLRRAVLDRETYGRGILEGRLSRVGRAGRQQRQQRV